MYTPVYIHRSGPTPGDDDDDDDDSNDDVVVDDVVVVIVVVVIVVFTRRGPRPVYTYMVGRSSAAAALREERDEERECEPEVRSCSIGGPGCDALLEARS